MLCGCYGGKQNSMIFKKFVAFNCPVECGYTNLDIFVTAKFREFVSVESFNFFKLVKKYHWKYVICGSESITFATNDNHLQYLWIVYSEIWQTLKKYKVLLERDGLTKDFYL